MKRIGNRGDGEWQTISWTEALTEVADRLKAVKESDAPESLACISGSSRGTVSALFQRLLTVCGSPNFFRPSSMEDGYRAAFRLMYGEDFLPGFDVENADHVLSFGSGIIDGWGSTSRMFRANSIWKEKGVKVVQVDPRLSNTAAKADQWVPIQPGAEGLLALAIAHVIIKESLYDYSFINHSVAGFDDFRNLVMDGYSPSQVSADTGIDAATITALAQDFARAKHPIAIGGRGRGELAGSLGESLAVLSLNVLVGNINRTGGVWTMPHLDYIQWPEPEMGASAMAGLSRPRIDQAGPLADQLLHRLPQAIEAGADIQALLVCGANPLYGVADATAMQKAFDRIPFIASIATHIDETTAYADIVLPAHSHLERWEDVPVPSALGKPTIGLARPVVDTQFNTLHPGDVVLNIAAAMGGDVAGGFPWPTYEACLKETLGSRWATLERKGVWVDEGFSPMSLDAAALGGVSPIDLSGGTPGLRALMAPVPPEGDAGAFPLILIPYDTIRLSADMGTPPFMVKTVPDTVIKGHAGLVEINPETARAVGVREGDAVTLATPKGSATVRVHLFDGILPGVVAMPRGLGHTAFDAYLSNKGVNVNQLIGAVEDPITGLNAAWGIRASLSRA
jgi:anaerobic selenocysteine-containing dehydrogenase